MTGETSTAGPGFAERLSVILKSEVAGGRKVTLTKQQAEVAAHLLDKMAQQDTGELGDLAREVALTLWEKVQS